MSVVRVGSRRLTAEQRRDRTLTEEEFQRQLVGPQGIATMLGWLHVHHRPAQTRAGWRTPGSGELIQGWPDLVLVRERDRRLIFAELKREIGALTLAQEQVLAVLRTLERADGSVQVHVWRPSDLPQIAEVLQ